MQIPGSEEQVSNTADRDLPRIFHQEALTGEIGVKINLGRSFSDFG
jgi:hypothetical protein